MGKKLRPKAKPDFLRRLGQATPMDALEELIWNAFDESPSVVNVVITENALGGVDRIDVIDDGGSMSHADASVRFENLGDSNKVHRRLGNSEALHGQRGEGRFKAFSLGKRPTWKFVYPKGKSLISFSIEGATDSDAPFYLTDELPAAVGDKRGCTVTISDIRKTLHAFTRASDLSESLARRFAAYLLRHSDRALHVNGRSIDPRLAVDRERRLRPVWISFGGKDHSVDLQVIHWKAGQKTREAWLCGADGITLHKLPDGFVQSPGDYSVFVMSDLFESLHQENLLQTLDRTIDPQGQKAFARIKRAVRAYFRRLQRKAADQALEDLKKEGSYPYQRPPASEIETVERNAFDICTLNISRHLPSFGTMDVDGRKLLLRMLQETVGQNASAVGRIIRELLNLPASEQERFAYVLEEMPLSGVINAAHIIGARLKFLQGLKAIVHLKPFDDRIRERTQLHRILVQNTWLFGEEYAIGADDEPLFEVLTQFVRTFDREVLQQEVDDDEVRSILKEYNRSAEGKETSLKRIPDLMLWRKFHELEPGHLRFLIVELKRPGVHIGSRELQQIRAYAKAVMGTPGVADRSKSSFEFVLLSDDISEDVADELHQENRDPNTLSAPAGKRYKIKVYRWDQILQAAEGRHQHLQKWLGQSSTLERAMQEVEKTYRDFLPVHGLRRRGGKGKRKRRA